MYENMVDVLIYLYENYMDGESQPPTDQGALEHELTEAGSGGTDEQHIVRHGPDEVGLVLEVVWHEEPL